ncbi:MAG: hypothetical protein KAJ51_17515, partial [Thermoplasmata archaeon]|nr:hypothetical protein [Thermoplasmata archaeon]
ISIEKYLDRIFYFGLDAYSIRVTGNATYLDYISELPGHPEYVSPVVEADEGLDGGDDGKGESSSDSDSDSTGLIIGLVIGIVAVVLIVLILLAMFTKRRRQEQ